MLLGNHHGPYRVCFVVTILEKVPLLTKMVKSVFHSQGNGFVFEIFLKKWELHSKKKKKMN
uniref:Uncharacterized protein n=1 Tax=Helianthus annuus TaxID=4232 RepID=A0A251SBI4_HELAN